MPLPRPSRPFAALLALSLLLPFAAACRDLGGDDRDLEAHLRARIASLGLTGDPTSGLDLPSIDDPLARLGMQLFFTKALGGDMDTACASCHHPILAGGDGLALSIGVGAVDPDVLGPGRTHESGVPNVARNAPTVFNSGLWRRAMFHDTRLETLGPSRAGDEALGAYLGIRTPDVLPGLPDPLAGPDLVTAQSRFPIVSPAEMLGYTYAAHKPHRVVRAMLSARLGDYGIGRGELRDARWVAAFESVFGQGIRAEALVTEQNIALAIGAYQRSQVFVDTPWRAYVRGDDDAIGNSAKRGALDFFTDVADGGAGCWACHGGEFFTDERAYVLAVPQVGPGVHDDRYADPAASVVDDFGCWHATFEEADRYAFRTPTLLNVEVTGPYGHDGAYATLEGIVRHHLDPAAAVLAYDRGQLDPMVQTAALEASAERALAKLAEDRRHGRTPLRDLVRSDRQVEDLLHFLYALTDPCVKDPACLAPWVPGPGDPDPDGLRLVPRLETGKELP